jgi:PAS domain S-box-containing protein
MSATSSLQGSPGGRRKTEGMNDRELEPRRPEERPGWGSAEDARRLALRVVVLYAAVASAWIVCADLIVNAVVRADRRGIVQAAKGSAFVIGSGVLLYVVVRVLAGQRARAHEAELQERRNLERSEHRYRHLVEMLPGVVYRNEIDADDATVTRCVYISPQIHELLGYTPQEWIDDPDLWIRVIHPDDRAAALAENERAVDTGNVTFEYRAIHRDGSTVWIHDEGVLVHGGEQYPGYWQGVMVDTTAQRIADAGLHELAESLRGVFAAAPVAIIVLEPDGRVRQWNPAAERMFGWTAEEVVGRDMPNVPEDDRVDQEDFRARGMAGEGLAGVGQRRMRKDGSTIDVEIWTAPLRDADGHVTGLMRVLEDVTDRKRVQDELRLRSEMLENVNDAVIAMKEDRTILYWNRGAERLYGWTADEVLGRSAHEILRIGADQEHIERIRESFRESGLWRGVELHQIRDGSLIPVEAFSVRRTRPDGPPYILTVNRDVREQRAAEAILEQRAKQQAAIAGLGLFALERIELQALLDRAAELIAETLDLPITAILQFEPDGGSLLIQAGVGWRPGTVGNGRVGIGPSSFAGFALSQGASVISDDVVADPRFEVPERLRDHGVVCGATAVINGLDAPYGVMQALSREPHPFSQDDIRFLEGVASIVGLAIERDRIAREHTRLRDELAERAVQLQRLADERQQMLRRVVGAQEDERDRVSLELHDGLGQLLTSISLFATDLEHEVPPSARPRVARVNDLVKRAIADSRELVWSLRPPELDRLGLVPSLRRLAEEVSTPQVTVDLHERIGDLRLGPEAEAVVYRVVQEAVHNAQKHAGASAISILLRRRNGVVSTIVEDDGSGFDPRTVAEGRGLGLIGMRERAELVDGEVVVESTPGAGTTVRLEVPVAPS